MSANKPESMDDIIDMMTPEVHLNLKTAVELGKWPDGKKLSAGQLEHCLQAIIAYEKKHLPEERRVGYIDRTGLNKTACDDEGHTHDAADAARVAPVRLIRH